MQKEFYVSQRSVWIGVGIIAAVCLSLIVQLVSVIWG